MPLRDGWAATPALGQRLADERAAACGRSNVKLIRSWPTEQQEIEVVLPREAARNLLYVVETATDVLVLEHAAVVSVQVLITFVGSEVIA